MEYHLISFVYTINASRGGMHDSFMINNNLADAVELIETKTGKSYGLWNAHIFDTKKNMIVWENGEYKEGKNFHKN